MGGKAFPELHVPRLSHEEYYELRDKYICILKENFYTHAISAPEPPSKVDHGDIDILVSEPTREFTGADLSKALGAVRNTKAGVTMSFAVPHAPEQRDADGRLTCAQVDLHVCAPGYLEWEHFLGSYGDLSQVLGLFNRAIGLTANNMGLYVRIPEIQPYNRKKSMLFLTNNVQEMMQFLGLDFKKYSKGFTTNEEIFAWCVAGRFYLPLDETKEHESCNDRQRYRKRPMFTACISEYLPSHPEIWAGRRLYTRKEVIDEALVSFPHAGPAYSAALAEHKQRCWEEQIMSDLSAVIPLEGEKLREAVRGLKRFVAYEDGGGPALCQASPDPPGDKPRWIKQVVTTEQKDELTQWVRNNWPEISRRERARLKAKK